MVDSNILEVKNLRKVFDKDLFKKKQLILDDLSLIFPEGKCTALMGHNGAGKTTTIRTIFGLIKPDKGEILFKGRSIKLNDKRLIGYMPETNKLPSNLTCQEVLSHQLRVFKPSQIKTKFYKETIEKKLREVELWEHRSKRVGKLSKGMGRRLSWAQATIHQPELIILDEPMSGLDPLGYRLMANLINQLRNQGVSIILCTHELWSIRELCDHVHIIKQGRLAFSSLDQDETKSQTMQHFLALSGCGLEDLPGLQKAHSLPAYSLAKSHAHRLELWLKDYSDAVQWLKICLEKGLIVIDFKKASSFDENLLIGYFAEDKKV